MLEKLVSKKSAIFAVFLIITLFILLIVSGAGYTSTSDFYLGNWMSAVDDDIALRDIVMPGSHDAATYESKFFDDTQDLSIYEQLNIGTRYFDLRVMDALTGNKEKHENLRMYHGIIPTPTTFYTVATEIREFIEKEKSEFLILDFQHFRNQPHEQIVEIIEEVLSPDKYALKRSNNVSQTTMADIRKMKARYIITWGSYSSYVDLEKDYIHYRQDTLFSPYQVSFHNQTNQRLIQDGFDNYYSLQDERLFVLQSQKTGNMSDITTLSPYANELKFAPYAAQFINSLKTNARLECTNIIMRDFLNTDKTTAIIELNLHKDTIKKSYIKRLKSIL
ncbi:MAG: phosphatidylinositol-specific phospholipase C domain-containing protein [Bacillota bacterium]